MRYLSLFSGIEAATVAWDPLGWKPFGFAEFDKQPSAVLAHHYPEVPNFGDVNKFKEWPAGTIDLICGGSPCQSFSVAGLRKGMEDPRGNMALVYLAVVNRYRPKWVVYENVPGLLSSNGGRDFGSILGGLVQLGYGVCYRVLDAQFVRVDGFGRAVPQRRRRVFVVGYLGDWRRAAAVLFEPGSMRGDPAPRRKTGEEIANTLGGSSQSGGFRTTDLDNQGAFIPEVAWALQERDSKGADSDTKDGRLLVEAFGCRDSDPTASGNVSPTLRSMSEGESHQNGGGQIAVAFEARIARNGRGAPEDICPPLSADADKGDQDPVAMIGHNSGAVVRRLTPRECERLQGFTDDYTLVPYGKKLMADGPRYKMLGNSMAVNCMRWLGWRIQLVDQMVFSGGTI